MRMNKIHIVPDSISGLFSAYPHKKYPGGLIYSPILLNPPARDNRPPVCSNTLIHLIHGWHALPAP